jgi:biopolymer transport protein ExbB
MNNLAHYIERGGTIVEILIVLNIIGFTIMLAKVILFVWQKRKSAQIVESIVEEVKSNHELKEYAIESQIDKYIESQERGLGTIRVIATIAPLLGLLGTVVGVLMAFDAIGREGLGDPTIFSQGISVALITTVAGLIVAIPHHIGYNYFVGYLNHRQIDLKQEVLKQL